MLVKALSLRSIYVYSLFVVFLSKLIWYDLRTIVPDQAVALLNASFLWYSIMLLPFVLFFLVKTLKVIIHSKIILMFFLINIYGMFVGIAYGNLNMFFVQDMYKFLFFPVGFSAAAYWYYYSPSFDRFFYIIYWVMFVFALVRSALHYYLGGDIIFLYGTVHDLFLISMSVGMLWKNPLSRIIGIITILLVILGNKRTLLVMFIMNLVVSFIFFFRNVKLLVWLARIVMTLLAVILCVSYITKTEQTVFKRFLNTASTYESDVGEDSKRLREVTTAYDLIQESAPFSLLFGFGSGAYFLDPVPNEVTGVSVVHSIHFTPMAYLYRYGLVGFIFIIALYGSFVRIVLFFSFSSDRVVDFSVKLTIISSFIMSFMVYSFVDDVFLGFIYGLYFMKSNYFVKKSYKYPVLYGNNV